MDIDGPTAQGIAGPVAQDLHVPCQYDQVALRRCDQIQYATLLLGAGLRRDREMMERNVVAGGQLPEIGMIGDHPATSMFSSPLRWRNSRSFKQWPCFDTRISTRLRLSMSWIANPASSPL